MNQQLFLKLINVNAPVLITGPTGAGKSVLARKIFDLSTINKEKFLTLHLASLKDDLLESELFGHKKGSFTGAVENKNGYFKDVGTGTLFLDEVGELSLEAQKKLLYLLEEKKFTPIGSTVAQPFQGRLLMATNKDLKEMVAKGAFREDLYFRLCVFHLELEGIAQNKEKLVCAINDEFMKCKAQHHRPLLGLSSQVLELMMHFPWKGNYRELKNCLEYMVVMADKTLIQKEDMPAWFFKESGMDSAGTENNFISHFAEDMDTALTKFEAWYLRHMLNKYEGRVNLTARVLGISKTTLINKARKYEINTLKIKAQAIEKREQQKAA